MKDVICDLDGTIALDTGRAKECLHSGKRDWDAYFARCHEDAPNLKLLEMLKILHGMGSLIWIISGRREDTREATVKWLGAHGVPWDHLHMRPMNNRVDDHLLKPRLAMSLDLRPDSVLCVFEDRDRVVQAWRESGYLCLQVAPGDF